MEESRLNQLGGKMMEKLHEDVKDFDSLRDWRKEMIDLIDQICKVKVPSSPSISEENSSFDPSDWISARAVAHEILDSSLDYIQDVRKRPVYRSVPDDIRVAIEDEVLPEKGQSLLSVCEDTLHYVMPYARGNIHPRYWGWVSGEGTLGGMIATIVETTLNINCCSPIPSSAFVEGTVIEWMRQIFDFPKDTTAGLLVSGTSIATILSMASARCRAIENVREDGMRNAPQLVAYASTEVHVCVKKALELLGLGSKALHLIPVDNNFRMKIDHLKEAIENDRKNGLLPFCIVGNAGTVNTGAFDDLLQLSSIARDENIWFHVDGAFGSFIILDPQRRHFVSGIDQADSLVFDFHKWIHCPFEAGCVLIRDVTYLQSTFLTSAPFLPRIDRTNSRQKRYFLDMGLELSRSFRALKVWFTLKEHGLIKLGQKIHDNCEQALYFLSLLDKHQHLIRVVRPVFLNIVNFRFEPEQIDKTNGKLLDLFNENLLKDIEQSGIALPSVTRLGERIHIRVCIVSHRCVNEDFHLFMETLFKLYPIRLQAFINEHYNSSIN